MAPTTPIGSFTVSVPPTVASISISGASVTLSPKTTAANPVCSIGAIMDGVPTSPTTDRANSSLRAMIPSAIRPRAPRRSSRGVADQPANAARAAATARSTSATPPAGTRPMTSSVEALTTSMLSSLDGLTHAPPMYSRENSCMRHSLLVGSRERGCRRRDEGQGTRTGRVCRCAPLIYHGREVPRRSRRAA